MRFLIFAAATAVAASVAAVALPPFVVFKLVDPVISPPTIPLSTPPTTPPPPPTLPAPIRPCVEEDEAPLSEPFDLQFNSAPKLMLPLFMELLRSRSCNSFSISEFELAGLLLRLNCDRLSFMCMATFWKCTAATEDEDDDAVGGGGGDDDADVLLARIDWGFVADNGDIKELFKWLLTVWTSILERNKEKCKLLIEFI